MTGCEDDGLPVRCMLLALHPFSPALVPLLEIESALAVFAARGCIVFLSSSSTAVWRQLFDLTDAACGHLERAAIGVTDDDSTMIFLMFDGINGVIHDIVEDALRDFTLSYQVGDENLALLEV